MTQFFNTTLGTLDKLLCRNRRVTVHFRRVTIELTKKSAQIKKF